MRPYHKSAIEEIIFALTESPGPILQKDLPGMIGVDERYVRRVIRDLERNETVRIKPQRYNAGNLVYLRPEVKKDLRKFWRWVYSRAEKPEILTVKSPGLTSPGHIKSKPLTSSDLEEYFHRGHRIYSFIYLFLLLSLSRKFAEFPDPESVFEETKKAPFSRGLKVCDFPVDRPKEIDTGFKNNRYKEFARRNRRLEEPYKLKPPSDMNLTEWENALSASENNCFPYYEGLSQIARDLAAAEALLLKYQEVIGKGASYLSHLVNPNFQAIRQMRVFADAENARYGDWCEAIVVKYPEGKVRIGWGKVIPLEPKHFAGLAARRIYRLAKAESSRMNRLQRAEIAKLDPDFLPENYEFPGTEKQNRYFAKVMDEIGRYADAQKRTSRADLESTISQFIKDGIMAQEFAESSLNTLCPGFKFKRPLTMPERLAGITQ